MYCTNRGIQVAKLEESLNANVSSVEKIDRIYPKRTNPNSKKWIQKGMFVSLIFLFIGFFHFFILGKNKEEKRYSNVSDKTQITYHYSEDGIPKFINGRFSGKKVNTGLEALEALEDIKEIMKFQNIQKEFILEREETSNEITYYRFKQVYNGIPVLNQNIIISVDKDKNILGFSGYYIADIKLDTNPALSKENIEEIAKKSLGREANIVKNELSIWNFKENTTLVYVINGFSNTKVVEMIIDANNGEILSEVSLLLSSSVYSYTGRGIDNKKYTIDLEEYYDIMSLKKRYKFYDLNRKIAVFDYREMGPIASALSSMAVPLEPITVDIKDGMIDNKWLSDDFLKDAISTMANFEKIYDYYKKVLERDSYDNKGGKIKVNIGLMASTFSSEELNNAFWFGPTNQMYIGSWKFSNLNGNKTKSFSAALDVLGHEFTHGVIQYTAEFASSPKNKDEAFETGALGEAYADIMGSLIEGKNWTIAEDVQILRSAIDPGKYKNASIKNGEYYYPNGYLKDGDTVEKLLKRNNLENVTDYDKGGVHQNATVVTHAAYLMYEAGAFKNREEMAKVWYNSLFLLSSYSNFEDCALAVIQTAKTFGLGEDALYKITKAFIDTKMLEDHSYMVTGTVKSGEEVLKDVKIEILSYEDGSLLETIYSTKDGMYTTQLKTGVYKIKVMKDGFKDEIEVVHVNGNVVLDFSLIYKKIVEKNNKICQSDDCVQVTMYFLENMGESLGEKSETYVFKKGVKLDSRMIVDTVNKSLGINLIASEGETFYIKMGDFTADFAWYYKGTNEKFNWNEPIDEDIEIEMKLYEGLLDDNIFKNIYDLFN